MARKPTRQAAFQTRLCTLSMGAMSGGTAVFIAAANGYLALDVPRTLGALGAIMVGSWLAFMGRCATRLRF